MTTSFFIITTLTSDNKAVCVNGVPMGPKFTENVEKAQVFNAKEDNEMDKLTYWSIMAKIQGHQFEQTSIVYLKQNELAAFKELSAKRIAKG